MLGQGWPAETDISTLPCGADAVHLGHHISRVTFKGTSCLLLNGSVGHADSTSQVLLMLNILYCILFMLDIW